MKYLALLVAIPFVIGGYSYSKKITYKTELYPLSEVEFARQNGKFGVISSRNKDQFTFLELAPGQLAYRKTEFNFWENKISEEIIVK